MPVIPAPLCHAGTDALPVAWADDGVIEAIEAPVGESAVGLQCHGECLTAIDAHAALFRALVDAAAGRAASLEVAEAA